jgi:hypothetical protein
LFRVLEGFPDLAHDDEVDACSGALDMLNPQIKGWNMFELYRRQAEQLLADRAPSDEARDAPGTTMSRADPQQVWMRDGPAASLWVAAAGAVRRTC